MCQSDSVSGKDKQHLSLKVLIEGDSTLIKTSTDRCCPDYKQTRQTHQQLAIPDIYPSTKSDTNFLASADLRGPPPPHISKDFAAAFHHSSCFPPLQLQRLCTIPCCSQLSSIHGVNISICRRNS